MITILGPRVFVRFMDSPTIKSDIIFIPETVEQEQSRFAMILAVGNGEREGITRRKMDVNPGDIIIVGKYSGSPVNTIVNGQEIEGHIVMEEDVLCRIEYEK